MDVFDHPQVTHLATQKGSFPGSGLALYWLEYRGYSAAEELLNLWTPLGGMTRLQKANLATDIFIFGVGGATAIYLNLR